MEQKEVKKPRKKNTILSLKQKQEVYEIYNLNHTNENIAKISKDYNIDRSTVYRIVDSMKMKEKQGEIARADFNDKDLSKQAKNIMKKLLNRMEKEIDSPDTKISISQLATVFGILYDKSRLEENKSTTNKAIDVNIHVDD